jgi:hypothetical protein
LQDTSLRPIDELSGLVSGPSRAVIIAQRDVNLQSLSGENTLFVLRMAEGSLAAGGRGGGFGERRLTRVSLYHYKDGLCEKLFDTEDEDKVNQFEVPYYVARMPLTLVDGTESMGYGVVEPELVDQYITKTK